MVQEICFILLSFKAGHTVYMSYMWCYWTLRYRIHVCVPNGFFGGREGVRTQGIYFPCGLRGSL